MRKFMLLPKETFLPQRLICEPGAILRCSDAIGEFGERGLIVHGRSLESSGRLAGIVRHLSAGMHIASFRRPEGEPTLGEITAVIDEGRRCGARWIMGIGGGSSIDVAKAAAGLFNAAHAPVYYQEGGRLLEPGIPFIAAPTTAGTGSEATNNAVIINPEKRVKLSIRDNRFMARLVILDVGLVEGCPRQVVLQSGMDALVQGVESFVSRHATQFSGMYAEAAIRLVYEHIVEAVDAPQRESLSALLIGSYYAGVSLAAARLGVVHGIAHPLGVLYNQPHGLVCAACFVPALKVNRDAMGDAYGRLSGFFGGDCIEKIEELNQVLGVRSPFAGKKCEYTDMIVSETLKSGSTAANPKTITRDDVLYILSNLFK